MQNEPIAHPPGKLSGRLQSPSLHWKRALAVLPRLVNQLTWCPRWTSCSSPAHWGLRLRSGASSGRPRYGVQAFSRNTLVWLSTTPRGELALPCFVPTRTGMLMRLAIALSTPWSASVTYSDEARTVPGASLEYIRDKVSGRMFSSPGTYLMSKSNLLIFSSQRACHPDRFFCWYRWINPLWSVSHVKWVPCKMLR